MPKDAVSKLLLVLQMVAVQLMMYRILVPGMAEMIQKAANNLLKGTVTSTTKMFATV